jgi:hypothetical protein
MIQTLPMPALVLFDIVILQVIIQIQLSSLHTAFFFALILTCGIVCYTSIATVIASVQCGQEDSPVKKSKFAS